MKVKKKRMIKIIEQINPNPEAEMNQQKLGELDFHAAVGSKKDDYILLFNKKDVIKCKIYEKQKENKEYKNF